MHNQNMCKACAWNVSGVCENTNWKSGKPIEENSESACGFMFKTSLKPIGFKEKIDDKKL